MTLYRRAMTYTAPRRPIRVSFTAKTLSGLVHMTDFVLPPVVGDDLVCDVEVVLNGERKCRLAWSVEVREGDPFVFTVNPAEREAALAELLGDDEDDETPPPAKKTAKKTAKKAPKKTTGKV